MPRVVRRDPVGPRPAAGKLADILADELRHNHEFGQPLIDELTFSTGMARVNVFWDAWADSPLEDRTAVIHRAYQLVKGEAARERIALASGLTIPEAAAAGMLPYIVFPALRKTDPVSVDQCREAMIAEGASTLNGTDKPILRFMTEDDAASAIRRLSARLPGSEPVWVVTEEMRLGGPTEYGC